MLQAFPKATFGPKPLWLLFRVVWAQGPLGGWSFFSSNFSLGLTTCFSRQFLAAPALWNVHCCFCSTAAADHLKLK